MIVSAIPVPRPPGRSFAPREPIVELDLLPPRVVAQRLGRLPRRDLPQRGVPPVRAPPTLDVLAVTLLARRRLALAGLDRGPQALGERVRVREACGVDRPAAARVRRPVLVEEALQPGDLGLPGGERRGAVGEPAPGLGLREARDAKQALDALQAAHEPSGNSASSAARLSSNDTARSAS